MSVESLSNARENLPNVYTNITAREVDFVTRFERNWQSLQEILGIMRPVRKAPGTSLVSYTASVSLASGDVDPGNVIPYSKATVEQVGYADLSLKKYAKAVPIEDVNKYGAAIAVEKTDDAFLNELQGEVLDDFYDELTGNQHALTPAEAPSTFQMAISLAIGMVKDKFKKMRRNVTDVVVFVNTMDVYRYLGSASISIQTLFGMDYVQNFLGATTVILSSEIEEGKVIAIPAENIILYYIDPSDSEFAKLGLQYTTSGETNLIGFHANGNYTTAVGESFALLGLKLWLEYADGEAIVPFNNPNMTGVTVTTPTAVSYWGTNVSDMQTGITISGNKITGTLKKLTSGQLVTDWGEGYFLAVKFTNFSSGVTYDDVKVGLRPSVSSGLVTLDNDQDAVMKVTDKDTQKLVVEQRLEGKLYTQYFDLSGLVLEGA